MISLMIRNALSVIAGGMLAFIWSSLSWMVLPWHQPTMNVFENEESVGAMIKEAAPKAGIYTYPGWTDDAEDMKKKHGEGPYVFASIVPGGVGVEMGRMMFNGILISVLGSAFLLILMLVLPPGTSWKQKALVGIVAAIFVSLVPPLLNWNWWHFPMPFTIVAILDGIVAWSIAAIAIALIISRGQKA